MKSAEIRQTFLDFFAQKGHQIVASSSLVPHGDPTLLFTNAGMNQFKDVFLGSDKRAYQRATSSQKCVRAGGKHNDLENVGFTARHHTFFEMLGNFSFGDYFKSEAICYAWELLTEVFKLPKERLWITIYAEDDEAFAIWTNKAGVPAERVIRIGDNKGARYASDNFWMMGEVGPCGPCTEIFYDHGPEIAGGLPGSPDEDGDRYIEIWNNVFMQYNRDEAGVMHLLPKPSVDTGMGLERMAAVLQHVHNNYQTDLFIPLIRAAARETNCSDLDSASLKVLADHIRACSFLLADGVMPSNEGRGFVLRRIIRRAVRHGYKLGARQAFFYRLVADLVNEMGKAYPDLKTHQAKIEEILRDEETRFFATIDNGMTLLNSEVSKLSKNTPLSGETVFRLHDTYGFPLDLTSSICRELGIEVDQQGFAQAMATQREQARRAGKFKMVSNLPYQGADTEFVGYQHLLTNNSKVLALFRADQAVEQLHEGEEGVVVLDRTPFYAESGGQIGDSGDLFASNGLFTVKDTQKIKAQVWGHAGVVSTGNLSVGDIIKAKVDQQTRWQTTCNHSATHLLHFALRSVLGEHVEQKGSQVDDSKTRFDFAHSKALTSGEISKIENLVNQQIWQNSANNTQLMSLENAQKSGAMMLFGEKYGEEVRVVNIGDSVELCGGTHVKQSGDIGTFKIISESGISAGIRRIEAVCGQHTLTLMQQQGLLLEQLAAQLKTPVSSLSERIEQCLNHTQALEKELQQLKKKILSSSSEQLLQQVIELAGIKLLCATIDSADLEQLRQLADHFRDKISPCVIVLASVKNDKVSLVAALSKDLTKKYSAGKIVNFVAEQVGGKGGGRADMATAGGNLPENLPKALASLQDYLL